MSDSLLSRSVFPHIGCSSPAPSSLGLFRRAFSGRGSGHGYSDPNFRAGQGLVRTVIGINTAVFIAWQFFKNMPHQLDMTKMYEHFTLSTYNLQAGRIYTIITSAFSQKDVGHFVFNMMGFNLFAMSLVQFGVAPAHMLVLLFGSAIAGSVAHLYNLKPRFGAVDTALGASGVVMGLGAALTCIAPRMQVGFMFIPFPIPLWAMTLLYAGIDLFYLDRQTGVGHAAHLGGSGFGALYYAIFLRKFGGVLSFGRGWR